MICVRKPARRTSYFFAFCSSFCTRFIPAPDFLTDSLNFSETSAAFAESCGHSLGVKSSSHIVANKKQIYCTQKLYFSKYFLSVHKKEYIFFLAHLIKIYILSLYFSPISMLSILDAIRTMTPPDQVEWKNIGEIAKIGTGRSDKKHAIENGKYPFYVRSKNILRIDTYEFDEEAIIIPGE